MAQEIGIHHLFGLYRLPISHIEIVGHHTSTAPELAPQPRPQLPIGLREKIKGNYRRPRKVYGHDVLFADAQKAGKSSTLRAISRLVR